MRIREVSFQKLNNTGDFCNERAGVTVRLEKHDDYEAAFEAARLVVDIALGLRPADDRDARLAAAKYLERSEGELSLLSELKR